MSNIAINGEENIKREKIENMATKNLPKSLLPPCKKLKRNSTLHILKN